MINTYNNLLKILDKKQIFFIILLIIGAFFVSLLEIFSLSLAIPIVGFATNETNNNQIVEIINKFNFNISIESMLLIFFFTYIFKIFFTLYISILKENFIYKAGHKISLRLFEIYLFQPFYFIKSLTHSHLVRNLSQEILNFISLLSSIIIIISEIIILTVIFIFLLFFNAQLTLIISLIIISSVILYNFFYRKKIKKWAKDRQIIRLNLVTNLSEAIKCIREIKLSSKEPSLINSFNFNQTKEMGFHIKINIAQLSPRLFFEFIMIISVMFILVYGFNFNKLDNVFSTISIFILSGARFIPSCSKIVAAVQNYRFNTVASDLIVKELNLKNQIVKTNNVNKNINYNFDKNLTFQNVGFSYDKKNYLFKDSNLEIQKNQKILLMGESGSGKSTLLDLIAGLMKPTNGKIVLDNKIDVYETFEIWKKMISFVAQENFFFYASIKDNLLQGKKLDLKKLNEFLDELNLTKTIETLPEGLDTKIGDSGIKLSGGQLQRLAIIRAIYTKPDFLILDECTSALDQENEKKAINLVTNLNSTVIFSTHKKEIKNYFDKTLHIESNKILSK